MFIHPNRNSKRGAARGRQRGRLQEEVLRTQLGVNRARDIPAVPLFPVENRTFNFRFDATVDCFSFGPRDLCAMVGVCHPGALSSEVYPAFQSVRLNHVELWGPAAQSPSAQPTAVQAWVCRSLTNGNPVRLLGNVVQDVSSFGGVPTHTVLSARTRANSILRQWFEQDDHDYLFTVSGPEGSIMQINISYTWNLYAPRTANSITSNTYLGALGQPALGLSALDSGNPTLSRIVLPVPISQSLTAQIPIFA